MVAKKVKFTRAPRHISIDSQNSSSIQFKAAKPSNLGIEPFVNNQL